VPKLNPYLNFNGNCKEAMQFYQQCFGGDLMMQKLSESPMGVQRPSADGNKILHSILTKEELVMMGSDMIGEKLSKGNDVGLCLNCKSDDELQNSFSRLSEGAVIVTPLHQTFWGATYAELIDKYGMRWMLSYSKI
jgi:PhnB protein